MTKQDMPKRTIQGGMKVNSFAVLDRAVETGIRAGWERAHKHTATPAPYAIQDEIARAVMNEICEYFKFDEDES